MKLAVKVAVGAGCDSHGEGQGRYYVSLDPQNEKQMKDLAVSIAGGIRMSRTLNFLGPIEP